MALAITTLPRIPARLDKTLTAAGVALQGFHLWRKREEKL
jgi:predicted nucleic acid-binding Zn ribbon protein